LRHCLGSWVPPTGSRSSYVPILMITHVAAFYLLARQAGAAGLTRRAVISAGAE
jgi:hypothetical protein